VTQNSLLGKTRLSLLELIVGSIGGASAWLLHLGASYLLLTVGCNENWPGIRLMLIALTIGLVAASAWTGLFAYRRVKLATRHDWALTLSAGMERENFMMVVGTVGSAVFTLIILAQGLPPLFVPLCSEV